MDADVTSGQTAIAREMLNALLRAQQIPRENMLLKEPKSLRKASFPQFFLPRWGYLLIRALPLGFL